MADILSHRISVGCRYSRTLWLRRVGALLLGLLTTLALLAAWPKLKDAIFWATPHSIAEITERFLATEDIPGGVVAIGRAGNPPRIFAFGYADAETKRPMESGLRMRVASMSKLITAEAVARLVDRGRIGLDDRLADYFPEVEGAADRRYRQITIRHLLSHSSGIDKQTWEDVATPSLVYEADGSECRRLLMSRLSTPLLFDPGTRTQYADLGFCWLALVVEKVSGHPFVEQVRQTLLEPEGLTTMQIGEDGGPGRFATHHNRNGSVFPRLLTFAGGAWTSSAEDFFRLASLPIRPETRIPNGGGQRIYGLGWQVLSDGTLVHGGATAESDSIVMRTNDDIVVVAIFNGRGRNGRDSKLHLAERLVEALRRENRKEQKQRFRRTVT